MGDVTAHRAPTGPPPIAQITWSVKEGEVYQATVETTHDMVGKQLYIQRLDARDTVRVKITDVPELLKLIEEFVRQEGLV